MHSTLCSQCTIVSYSQARKVLQGGEILAPYQLLLYKETLALMHELLKSLYCNIMDLLGSADAHSGSIWSGEC